MEFIIWLSAVLFFGGTAFGLGIKAGIWLFQKGSNFLRGE